MEVTDDIELYTRMSFVRGFLGRSSRPAVPAGQASGTRQQDQQDQQER
jgi:hypothetical protein